MSNTYTHKLIVTDEESGDVIVTHHDFSEYKKYFLERWPDANYNNNITNFLWKIVFGMSDSYTNEVEDYKTFQDFDDVVDVKMIDLEED